MSVKLPKQWRDWCKSQNLKPYSRRFGGQASHHWFYLKGRGRVWRVNCHGQFERGDRLQEFDRWALCDSVKQPLPKTKQEFAAAVWFALYGTYPKLEGKHENHSIY